MNSYYMSWVFLSANDWVIDCRLWLLLVVLVITLRWIIFQSSRLVSKYRFLSLLALRPVKLILFFDIIKHSRGLFLKYLELSVKLPIPKQTIRLSNHGRHLVDEFFNFFFLRIGCWGHSVETSSNLELLLKLLTLIVLIKLAVFIESLLEDLNVSLGLRYILLILLIELEVWMRTWTYCWGGLCASMRLN